MVKKRSKLTCKEFKQILKEHAYIDIDKYGYESLVCVLCNYNYLMSDEEYRRGDKDLGKYYRERAEKLSDILQECDYL